VAAPNLLSPYKERHRELQAVLSRFSSLRGGKTRNVDIIWFPKPTAILTDMRNKLKVAYEQQLAKQKQKDEKYFVENEVAEELARRGAFTRPGADASALIEEYEEEPTPDKPHISSFRMTNRLFRFMGWTTRRVGYKNHYVVTDLGVQMTKFSGQFPGIIGNLSERDLVVRSLVNFGLFSVNDHPDQWDTRFKQRTVVNLLRVTAEYGYICNNELVVTAFALKDERDAKQVKEMMQRLRRLREGKITMIQAFEEVGVDPQSSSSVNNAYDGPKVLLSLCRQAGLLTKGSVEATLFGDLRPLYSRMHHGISKIKEPRVVNIISDYGREILKEELGRRLVWFDELA